MIATYKPNRPGKVLNVRSAPDAHASVVRTIEADSPEAVAVVDHGWAELADGWADARFLIIEGKPAIEGDYANIAPDPETEAGTPEIVSAEGNEGEAKGEAEGGGESEGGDNIDKMTVPELKKLAKDCNVKLRKDAPKQEIIDAIKNGEDD